MRFRYFRWVPRFQKPGRMPAIKKIQNEMTRNKFKLAHDDEELLDLVTTTGHETLAVWAIDCAERVLPYFEEKYPEDPRPRKALETLRVWITYRGVQNGSHS